MRVHVECQKLVDSEIALTTSPIPSTASIKFGHLMVRDDLVELKINFDSA